MGANGMGGGGSRERNRHLHPWEGEEGGASAFERVVGPHRVDAAREHARVTKEAAATASLEQLGERREARRDIVGTARRDGIVDGEIAAHLRSGERKM